MCMPPLFSPPQRMAEPTPLPPFFPPPEISSFWRTSITRFGTQEILPTPRGGSIPLVHLLRPPPSQWPWHTHPSPSLLWQSLLSWHLLCSFYPCFFLLLGGASGPGFWPSTNSFFRPSLSGLSPQRASPFLQFSESSLGWLCLLLWLSLSFFRGILVSFSFLCSCSLYLSGTECGQIFHSFRPHQTPS